jgi:hypothetical protein
MSSVDSDFASVRSRAIARICQCHAARQQILEIAFIGVAQPLDDVRAGAGARTIPPRPFHGGRGSTQLSARTTPPAFIVVIENHSLSHNPLADFGFRLMTD